MSLSDLSIKNPVFAVMLAAAMIVFGYLGYRDMGVSQFPEIDFPVVSVVIALEGASPEVMDGDVTVASEPGKGSTFTVRLPGGAEPQIATAGPKTDGVRRNHDQEPDEHADHCPGAY